MIRLNRHRNDSLCMVNVISNKVIWRFCKDTNLIRKRFMLLLLCYEYERNTNRLITASQLARFSPYNLSSTRKNLEYLMNRDYLVRIKGKRAKLQPTDSGATKWYDTTKKTDEMIHQFNTAIGRETAKWRNELPQWKKPSKMNQEYYKELGILG